MVVTGSGGVTEQPRPRRLVPFGAMHRPNASALTHAIDITLDVAVGAIAIWTVSYHLALIFHLSRDLAMALFVVFGVIAVVVWRQRAAPDTPAADGDVETGIGLVGPLIVAGIALVAVALNHFVGGPAFWIVAVVAVVAGLITAVRPKSWPEAPGVRLLEIVAVIVLAIAFAFAIAVVRAPNGDDAYYVNRALYVQQHDGPFPTKDTLYANQRYPTTQPVDNLASYEAMVGSIAAAIPIDARTLYYLVLGPLFGALGVLAVWRLARGARARSALFATIVAVAFVLLQTNVRGWTDFALRRAAEGKAVLLFFLVAWLWTHVANHAKTASRSSLVCMTLGGIAAIGLTSTGAFVAPLVVGAGALTAVYEDRRVDVRKIGGNVIAVVYPLLALVVGEFAVRTVSHVGIKGTFPTGVAATWSQSMGAGRILLVSSLVALAGWAFINDRTIRIGVGVAVLAVLVLFSPVFARLAGTVGVGSVLWRFAWAIPVPAVAGLAADSMRRFGGVRGLAVCLVVTVLALGILASQPRAVLGASPANQIAAPSWDVEPLVLHAAERLVRLADHRGDVAASRRVADVVPQVSTTTHAADVRIQYTKLLMRMTGTKFDGAPRLALGRALDGQYVAPAAITSALRTLDVVAACSDPNAPTAVADALRASGFRTAGADKICVFWSR